MATPAQIYTRAAEKMQRNQIGLSGRPFAGVVTGVHPEREFMDVRSYAGKHSVRVLHPYVGAEHWHRVGPGVGQRVSMQVRMDLQEPSAMTYLGADARDNTPEQRLAEYEKGNDLYRPLAIGEQEIVSSGMGQIFLGRRPVVDIRAGYVRGWYDQDSLEAGARAVTHVRQLHLNSVSEVGDEERFGGVTRPDVQSKVFRKIVEAPPGIAEPPNPGTNASAATDPAAAASAALPSTEPAKEWMYVLKTSSGTVIDHREGHVTDDSGQFVSGKLGGNLRYRKKIYGAATGAALSGAAETATSTGTGSETYEEQVDDKGNLYVGLPQTATEGVKFEVPGGKFKIKSGTASSELELDGLSGTMKLSSTTQGEVRAESGLKVHSAQVKLGQTDAAVNKAISTQVYKNAEKGMHTTLMGMGTADQMVNTVAGVGITALSSVFMAISAAPLCPGVLVTLMGMAQAIIPSVFHTANGLLKTAKGQTGHVYGQAWDSYESQTVSYSS